MFLQEHSSTFIFKKVVAANPAEKCSCRNIGRVLHTNSLIAQQIVIDLKCVADYAAL